MNTSIQVEEDMYNGHPGTGWNIPSPTPRQNLFIGLGFAIFFAAISSPFWLPLIGIHIGD